MSIEHTALTTRTVTRWSTRAADRGDAVHPVATETGRTLDFTRQARAGASGRCSTAWHRARRERRDQMPNGIANVRLLMGAMYSGRAVVPVNLLSQPEQMRYVLEHAGCRLIFASAEWAQRLRETLAGSEPAPEIVEVEADADTVPGEPAPGADEHAAAARPAAVSPGDLALLMYTWARPASRRA